MTTDENESQSHMAKGKSALSLNTPTKEKKTKFFVKKVRCFKYVYNIVYTYFDNLTFIFSLHNMSCRSS